MNLSDRNFIKDPSPYRNRREPKVHTELKDVPSNLVRGIGHNATSLATINCSSPWPVKGAIASDWQPRTKETNQTTTISTDRQLTMPRGFAHVRLATFPSQV